MKNIKRILIAILALVLVLNMSSCSVLIYTVMNIFDYDQDVMSSDEITVDDKMMSFFLNEYIMNWYTNYYSYMSFFSVDLTQDLKTQKYGDTGKGYAYETYFLDASFQGTWYDYFMKPVRERVEQYIVYASAGKYVTEKDLSLTAEQKAEIDAIIKSVNDNLALRGLTFSDYYGKGVKESDARRCYELIYLASNFATYFQEKLEGEITYNEIADYRENNKAVFYTADVLSYTIKETAKGITDKQYDDACAVAKAAVEAIARAKSPAEFIALIEKYEASLKETNNKWETETDIIESESFAGNEKEDFSKLDKYKDTIKYEDGTGNELNDFLFGNEEPGDDAICPAEQGDVTIIEETDTETEKVMGGVHITEKKEPVGTDSEENEDQYVSNKVNTDRSCYKTYTVTVYYVLEPMHYDTELTHNFAYLISDTKQSIFDFCKAFVACEEKNSDLFLEIAEERYNAIHKAEDHNHSDSEIFAYNKLEKQAAGWFLANGGDSYKIIDTWLDTADRKNGDLSDVIALNIISTDSTGKTTTSTQYAVIFFESHSEETWYVIAFDGAVSENFDEWYEYWLKTHNLKIDDAINSISTKKSAYTLSMIVG